jgi:ketosteroid isomerase-like protein
MSNTADRTAENVALVERFLAAFDGRWPTEAELGQLLSPDARFVERPNLVNPTGSERDATAMRAGIETGRRLLAYQHYEVRDHIAQGDVVVTRMRWTAELAIDAGPWTTGTRMSAWCVARYRLQDGRIAEIEQHDCYDPPTPPPA